MCGEKADNDAAVGAGKGSPPRVRGKVDVIGVAARAAGITPACAGKRWRTACCRGRLRDHPRVCGEKHGDIHHQSADVGSPPRVRGKDRWLTFCASNIGITPARAGKSCREI